MDSDEEDHRANDPHVRKYFHKNSEPQLKDNTRYQGFDDEREVAPEVRQKYSRPAQDDKLKHTVELKRRRKSYSKKKQESDKSTVKKAYKSGDWSLFGGKPKDKRKKGGGVDTSGESVLSYTPLALLGGSFGLLAYVALKK